MSDTPRTLALETVLMKLAQLRREPLDGLAVRDVLGAQASHMKPKSRVDHLLKQMNFYPASWTKEPDAGRLPMLVVHPERAIVSPQGEKIDVKDCWGLVTAEHPDGGFAITWWDEEKQTFDEEITQNFDKKCQFARMRFHSPFSMLNSSTLKIVAGELFSEKARIMEMGASTLVVNVLAIATSLYAMQVYDRVVPTAATATLLALTIGIALAIVFEMVGKMVRTNLMNNMSDVIDRRLARMVYARFLNIRLDQLPNSVGSTASRMRGYESIRSFLLVAATSFLFDFPMALIAMVLLGAIGGWLLLIPMALFVVGLITGTIFHRRLLKWAQEVTPAQHFKTGLVVESVEGAETIKSGQGGWRMLGRWLDVSDEVRELDRKMRGVSDNSLYVITMFQQLSYVLLIAFGSLLVSSGNLTFGGLIACSILSGRIFAPVAMLPKLLVQWAGTKATVQDLDALWKLEQDLEEGTKPIMLEHITGNYHIQNLSASYGANVVLNIPELTIHAGERVGIIGTIGTGKTTLLRLLSGMYKPQQGRVMLDGVDIQHIAKTSLSKHMGYMPQEGRLFAGSLRENLLLGLQNPGDTKILDVAKSSGLMETVIAPHPHGLERPIFEGGAGLSGGQRQLVHVTRAMLRDPMIWLMDEPTAHMDQGLEAKVLKALQDMMDNNAHKTMLLVTHKLSLVGLVDRLIVLGREKIVMDGPRDAVLAQLTKKAPVDNSASQAQQIEQTSSRVPS